MASRIWLLVNIYFYPPPQYICYLHRPKSVLKVLTMSPHYLYILVGGVWCCYHYTLAHIHLHCCSCPISPHQCGRLFRYRILRHYCDPVRLGSACSVPDSDVSRIAVSVYPVGGGGWGVCVVTWVPSRTSDSSAPLSLSCWGTKYQYQPPPLPVRKEIAGQRSRRCARGPR